MSEHIKEPREVKEVQGQVFVAVKPYKGHPYFERTTTDASARRIVACLNACAGVGTEWLESCDIQNGTLFSLQHWVNHADELRQHRDNLLEALKDVMGCIENGHDVTLEIRYKADAIIAEVEAGK